MTNFVNLTPHPVTLVLGEADSYTVPPSGEIARITEDSYVCSDGWTGVTLGDITGLPEPAAHTQYVVSMPLAMALLAKGVQRSDVVYPYDQVRDESGRIVGCRTLARLVAR